ncbi:MAG TPA: phenylacetate--CoA ligase family protein, partial [Ktedonobacterales bacterium]|nr:phenylacetate--CoA ligase family protein [Ktedonobacterales bacterium]
MAQSEYWNPKNETLPREQLQALQLAKLQRMTQWAYERSPFHRQRFDAAGFHPDQLKTLDDLRRIPFMTREDWMDSQVEQPLFGTLLTTG